MVAAIMDEAGLDYGGLMKELLEEVVVRGFHEDAGLFAATGSVQRTVYPRPTADRLDNGLQMLEFLEG
ncbi:HECT domain-containing protein [Haematococcus lacustris]|uniref:HECT-type E3 ubiquitin transferase n=1 Tax=Haematococcus lacustris TaxID=44745 RepID=A0A699YLM8_HAELA|nr:HECT domain-containing protein [Haematococcus lacustris]